MQTIEVTSNKIDENQICPTSKSYANRALIVGALKSEEVKITRLPEAQDVIDLITAFKEIGLSFTHEKQSITLHSSFPSCEKSSTKTIYLSGSEGGTTIRFLIPLLALGHNQYAIKLLGGLASRPMGELVSIVNELGGKAFIKDKHFYVQGPIELPASMDIDCSKTTQFASALKLLSIVQDFKVNYLNITGSLKYLLMTDKVLADFSKSSHYEVPYDASSLGYFIVYGLLSQNICISNILEIDDIQADTKIFDILQDNPGSFELTKSGLKINQSKIKAFDIDGSECIDLVPTLIVLATKANGLSTIRNVRNLIHKESNRLEEMMKILDHFSVNYLYQVEEDKLVITPQSEPVDYDRNIVVAEDHRMVMVAALMLKLRSGGCLSPANAVAKSFPQFFMIF